MTSTAVPLQTLIGGRILAVREQRVMLDADLAELYGVQTKVLVQAVKRNIARFPADFMFQLTVEEFAALRSQTVTSNSIIVFLLVLLPKLLFIHNLILFQPWNILRRLSSTRFPLFHRSKWYLNLYLTHSLCG